ncbi:MAG: hypothetical protein AB8G15_22930 [Saprospiraceae bacterium]
MKNYYLLICFIFCLLGSATTQAVPYKPKPGQVSVEGKKSKKDRKAEKKVMREIKKQEKKKKKVQKRMNKLKRKLDKKGVVLSAHQEAFFGGATNTSKFRLGLIIFLCGLLAGLVLASWLAWVGWLATVVGLVLMILGLLNI